MSNLLKEKRALAKLRAELEGRKGRLCRCCKGFGYLAQNCRKQTETERGATMPQNKFEVLKSRVMQCGVEERVVRSMRTAGVKCFKCGEEGHKCRMCPKKEKRVARPEKGKAQEEEKAARPIRREAQQEWRRSSMEELRKRAEEHCGEGVLREA